VRLALEKIKGSYALGILFEGDEECLIAARKESPLVIGLEREKFYRFGYPAGSSYTANLFYGNGEMALLSPRMKVFVSKEMRFRKNRASDWNPLMADKGGYKHSCQGDFETPGGSSDTIGVGSPRRKAMRFSKVSILIGASEKKSTDLLDRCGPPIMLPLWESSHRRVLSSSGEVDIGSSFRSRSIMEGTNLLVAISNPERRDTLAALR